MSFTSASDQDVKEQIRQSTDIVELIGGYLQLRRQGRGYVALCPWHDDSRPSLQVNSERQSWKCWVCDIGGDVFSFVMQREGVGFREALEMLAERAGIELHQHPQAKTRPGDPNDKRTLYNALTWAEQQFCTCLLHSDAAQPARTYLSDRGITAESIQRFHLGFSPDDWTWLLNLAQATEFSPQVLESAGILGCSPKSGRFYDRFKGRLIFSIRDLQNRPIAFGGRVLPETATPNSAKYINSPETRLFSKSDQLYGLDVARDSVAKRREIIVVEGYTDTIMAHQVGLDRVVAVLGTALGTRHIRLLRRFADRIVLVLDGDEAGQRRTNEILELFVAQQVDLRVLTLPAGLDPCDFLQQQGAEAFQAKVEQDAVDALTHKVNCTTQGLDLARDTHAAIRALEDVLSTIAKSPRLHSGDAADLRLREQQMLARLSRMFAIPESEIRTRLVGLRKKNAQKNPVPRPTEQEETPEAKPLRVRDMPPREIELIEILLDQPDLVELAVSEIETGLLQSKLTQDIFHTIHRVYEEGRTADFGNVLTAMDDPRLKNILVELDERAHAKAEEAQIDAQNRLQGLFDDFRFAMASKDRRRQQAALEEKRLDDQTQLDVLQQLIDQERNRQGISAPTEG